MKTKLLPLLLLTLFQTQAQTPTGEYFGQKKPGLTPEVFAPGFISTSTTELSAFLHPNGKEFYYTVEEGSNGLFNILVSRQAEDGSWADPKSLSIPNKESFRACITKDGSRLIFASIDLINDNDRRKEYNLWIMERDGDGWGDPAPLGPAINTPDGLEMFPSVADDGTLYFKRFSFKDETEKLYYAEPRNGRYLKAALFDASFNRKYAIEDPFVAPDESYIIFSPAGPDLFGPMHITFRDEAGKWSEPRDMGLKGELPSLSPDGKYLFFIREGDIWWVDAGIIETLR